MKIFQFCSFAFAVVCLWGLQACDGREEPKTQSKKRVVQKIVVAEPATPQKANSEYAAQGEKPVEAERLDLQVMSSAGEEKLMRKKATEAIQAIQAFVKAKEQRHLKRVQTIERDFSIRMEAIEEQAKHQIELVRKRITDESATMMQDLLAAQEKLGSIERGQDGDLEKLSSKLDQLVAELEDTYFPPPETVESPGMK